MQKLIEKPIPPPKTRATIQSEITDITPDIARAMLDKNSNNRNMRPPSVEAYARAMEDGKWLLTGDAIRFDIDGNLLDGQHRLMACIRANAPFRTMVLYGLPKEAIETIDTNIPRNAADVLKMTGHRSVSHLHGACRWLYFARLGIGSPQQANINMAKRRRITNQDVISIVHEHPKLQSYVTRIANKKPAAGSYAALAFIWYAAAEIMGKPELGEAFIEVFRTGIPSREGCPAHLYRERMLRMGNKHERITSLAGQRGLVHAWNQFAAGETLTVFKFPTTEVSIVGLDRKKL